MLGRLSHTSLLRYAGLYTWTLVGLLIILNIWFLYPSRSTSEDWMQGMIAVLAHLGFGACFWAAATSLEEESSRNKRWNMILLLAMNVAAIGVSYYTQAKLGAILLMIMASLLPWLIRLKASFIWLIVAHVTLVLVLVIRDELKFFDFLLQSLALMGISILVLITAHVAKQQAQARQMECQLNSELHIARALLAERKGLNEQDHILRDLHDS